MYMPGENEIRWMVFEHYSPNTMINYGVDIPLVNPSPLTNVAIHYGMDIKCKREGDLVTINIILDHGQTR